MARLSISRRKAASKTPSRPSPDAPIQVWIAGDFNAVELTRRLYRGGLMLKKDKEGMLYLVRSDRERDHMESRTQLFEARAIVEAARLAMASKLEGRDLETTIANALQAASRMIDGVASDLGGAP